MPSIIEPLLTINQVRNILKKIKIAVRYLFATNIWLPGYRGSNSTLSLILLLSSCIPHGRAVTPLCSTAPLIELSCCRRAIKSRRTSLLESPKSAGKWVHIDMEAFGRDLNLFDPPLIDVLHESHARKSKDSIPRRTYNQQQKLLTIVPRHSVGELLNILLGKVHKSSNWIHRCRRAFIQQKITEL